MTRQQFIKCAWLPAVMFVMFAAAVAFRPLLPIDETRYMSVAWEMLQRHGWLQPLTMNYEPYHHKPPLLFWMINLSWGIFGVSRWAGLIPIVAVSGTVAWLTARLGQTLFPATLENRQRTMLLMVGSIPFLIYSTLVLFDLTMTLFVLLALLNIIAFARDGRWRYALLAGLCMGLGVLTKGPVAYLYTLFPFVLAPLWAQTDLRKGRWYLGMLLAFVVSVIPVLAWLVPVLTQADNSFANSLLWNQTAGRISGNFKDAHNRPFYFYLPLLPVMFLPWMFFPAFWRKAKTWKSLKAAEPGLRFVLLWIVSVFLSFCVISGKQPHYLVPILPGMILLIAVMMQAVSTRAIAKTVALFVTLIVAGQGIASQTVLKPYDLKPFLYYILQHEDKEYAYVSNYHAEFGFLGRMDKPMHDMQINELSKWLAEDKDNRLAVIRFKDDKVVAKYEALMVTPYRGKKMGVFKLKE